MLSGSFFLNFRFKTVLFWTGYVVFVGLVSLTIGTIGGIIGVCFSHWLGNIIGGMVGGLAALLVYCGIGVQFPPFDFYLRHIQPWVSEEEYLEGDDIIDLNVPVAIFLAIWTPAALLWPLIYWLLTRATAA